MIFTKLGKPSGNTHQIQGGYDGRQRENGQRQTGNKKGCEADSEGKTCTEEGKKERDLRPSLI